MKKDISTKEYFKQLLENKNIKLCDEDFDQSYLSYRNFRKSYSDLLKEDYSEFEPRQRIFDLNE